MTIETLNGRGREEIPLCGAPQEFVGGAGAAAQLADIPLSLAEWLKRDLPEPDRLLGDWLTTTSRCLLSAATGLGKTNFAMALGMHAGAGVDFLHWKAHRPRRVLLIDGEMSRRLLKRRAEDAVRRLGRAPEGFHLLSREDVVHFPPLNSQAGLTFIKSLVKDLNIELVIFDNVMSLTVGNQKDPDAWAATEPLVAALTQMAVAQIWIDHTGHDTSRGYGSSTKTWRMDTVIHLEAVKRPDTDVSFSLEFRKARERTPDNHRDFETVTIALVNDAWETSAATARRNRLSPLADKFLEALRDTFGTAKPHTFQSWKAVKLDDWRQECGRRGLIDPDKAKSASALFSKYRRELIAADRIACNDDLVWIVS